MKTKLTFLILILMVCYSCQHTNPETVEKSELPNVEVSFYTSDSIKIYGDLYVTDTQSDIILLFHQGGSNAKAEYISIIPRLREMGYSILAIDQRIGGQVYGYYNRTLVDLTLNSFGDGYTYCDAYNNLESALDFVLAKGVNGKKIIWGSSYSAALAIQLGSKRQKDIDGILAFSPVSGGPMEACRPDKFFDDLTIPLLILRPPNEMERDGVVEQFNLAKEKGHQVFAAEAGVHGSSMLVEERVGADVSANWKTVESFLKNISEGK